MQTFKWYGKVLPKDLTQLRLVVLSDLHLGNPYCSEKHFLRTVDWCANTEDCVVMLNGDLCESAIRTSLGDVYKQVVSPNEQKKQIVISTIKAGKNLKNITYQITLIIA